MSLPNYKDTETVRVVRDPIDPNTISFEVPPATATTRGSTMLQGDAYATGDAIINDGLLGIPIVGRPDNGQVLKFNDTGDHVGEWNPATISLASSFAAVADYYLNSFDAATGLFTAALVGIGNVTGLTAALAALIPSSYIDTDVTLAANSDSKIATQKATKNYVDTLAAAVTSALALKAPLASPALTGNPTAPTQSTSDSSTKIATTAFVQAIASALGSGGSTILTGTSDPWASGTPATAVNVQSKVSLGLAVTTTSNVTAGNLLIVASGWAAGSAGSPVCTDTLGTLYTLRGIQLHDDGAVLAVFSGVAPSTGGCTVTVSSTSGTSFSQTAISEFSGVQDVINVSAFSKGNSTTQTATLTTTVSNCLLFAAIEGDHNTDTYSAASGYTRDNFINGSDAIATAWKQQSGSGSISGGFTGGLNFYALGFIAFWPFITGTPGVDGNFYINTSTKKMYGPKTFGSWPTTSILG